MPQFAGCISAPLLAAAAAAAAAAAQRNSATLSSRLLCPPAVLAIGGVGGLAVGLAGREILENLFTGLIILSSNPFEVRLVWVVWLRTVNSVAAFGITCMGCF